jgi:hypothetical protein
MYTYYMLAQHLRAARKRQVEKALLAWHEWTKERKETKSVQEAGWVFSVVSGESSSQEDATLDHQNDSGDDEEDGGSSSDDGHDQAGAGATNRSSTSRRTRKRGASPRRTPPKLKIVAARKGIQTEIVRIMESGPFFGEGPVEYEDETDEEPEGEQLSLEASMKAAAATRMESLRDIRLGAIADLEDLDESFDDFGFPVSLVQVGATAKV